MSVVRPSSWTLLTIMPFLASSACADEGLDDFDADLVEFGSGAEPEHLDPALIENPDSRLDDGDPVGLEELDLSDQTGPESAVLSFPPPVDGFVNPLSPTGFADEIGAGGIDTYYNARDWTHDGGHCGEDWNYTSGGSTDLGEDVYATANGIVKSAADYGGKWGKIVMIEHYIPGAGDPAYRFITSTYAHLENYSVSPGDVVVRGQKIGEIGDANDYYLGAAHLHFEMRWDETMPANAGGYDCYNTSSGTFDPTTFIDSHRSWEPTFGGWSFCTVENPCGPMEGDADNSLQCLAGTSYGSNTGAKYDGWAASVDTCESECHPGSPGGFTYCSAGCPCGIGEGDCDSNDECAGELICRPDVGTDYGWGNAVDVCEACHIDDLGHIDYCSPSCPCEAGEGDCDSDADCRGSLSCMHNIGAQYGFHPSYDVCG